MHNQSVLLLVGAQDSHGDALEDTAQADGVADFVRGAHAAGGRGCLEARLLVRQR